MNDQAAEAKAAAQLGENAYEIFVASTRRDPGYPWIRKWGERLRSHEFYISEQIARARAEDAPSTAIYRREDGTWATIDGLSRRLAGLRANETAPHNQAGAVGGDV